MTRVAPLLVPWVLVVGLPVSVWARAGGLDPTFGTGGFTTVPSGAPVEAYTALEIEPDGRIVTLGGSGLDSVPVNLVLARYHVDGTLDASFGSGGSSTISPSPSFTHASRGLVRQPDGKLVATGAEDAADPPFFLRSLVFRFDADGALDPTFGTGGIVTASSSTGSFILQAPALQPDGKIVAGGFVGPFGDQKLAVARFDADGALDSTFGDGGIASVGFGSDFASAIALVVLPDGRIVAAGETDTANGSDAVLVRFDAAGALDPSFGTGGVVRTDVGLLDSPWNLFRQPDGDLVVVGETGLFTNMAMMLLRYDADGALDTSFGAGGVVRLDLTPGRDLLVAALAQLDGKIVAAGSSGGDAVLLRVAPDGTPDAGFGLGGLVTALGGVALARQPDGRLVVVGGLAGDYLLARYVEHGVCTPTPRTGCKQPTVAGKAALKIRHATTGAKDQLAWTWTRGDATTASDLGDPTGATSYALCLYDEAATPTLVYEASAPAGGVCHGQPCWLARGAKGFRYRDRDGTPDGVLSTSLQTGAAGHARAAVVGRGAQLGTPITPLPLPLRVQVQTSDAGCFEARYTPAGVRANDAMRFQGVSQ